MLELYEKIEFFKKELLTRNNSYADYKKDEIHDYFFQELEGYSNIDDFSFLKLLATEEDIISQIELIISKIIMHENHSGLEELILEYLVKCDEDVAMLRLKELVKGKVKPILAKDIWSELDI